jgi:hypothetical protein
MGSRWSTVFLAPSTNKQTDQKGHQPSFYIYLYLVVTHSHKMSSTTTPRSLLLMVMATTICTLPLSAAQSGPQAALIPPCVVRSFLSLDPCPFSDVSRLDESIEFVADHHRARRNRRPATPQPSPPSTARSKTNTAIARARTGF